MSPSKCQYDDDFYRWTQTQGALLREEKAADLEGFWPDASRKEDGDG